MGPAPELSGTTAIVTGASKGLGREIALRLALAGADVVVAARGASELEAAAEAIRAAAGDAGGCRVRPVHGDVSNRADTDRIVRAAEELLEADSRIVLINNAGVYGPKGPIDAVSWDAWVQAIEINLFGSVLMMRGVIPLMRERGYGKIVNLSGGGATGPLPRISAYAASKAALVRLTETVAEEVREDGIDVNAIAPGALNTRLLDEVLAAGPEKVGTDFYRRATEQQQSGGVPLAKGAALAVFLASAASDGITGRLLSAVWDDWQGLPDRARELTESDVYTLRRIVPEDRGW